MTKNECSGSDRLAEVISIVEATVALGDKSPVTDDLLAMLKELRDRRRDATILNEYKAALLRIRACVDPKIAVDLDDPSKMVRELLVAVSSAAAKRAVEVLRNLGCNATVSPNGAIVVQSKPEPPPAENPIRAGDRDLRMFLERYDAALESGGKLRRDSHALAVLVRRALCP